MNTPRTWLQRMVLAGAFAACFALPASAQPNEVPTAAEFRELLGNLPRSAVTHNGTAFTYGFELEGKGNGLTRIARPTDAETNARWDSMNDSERRAYYDRVVGENHSSVKTHFELDTNRHRWLDPYWYVEGTGNWEIHSRVMKSVGEITDAMREAKELTGKSGKGFHLHMRDNAPDWERLSARSGEFADWIERSSNWVYLKRVERLRTDLSLKSWSNARMSDGDLSNVERLSSTGRATVRIASVNRSGPEPYIDIEIRGFTKYVDDVETLAKIYTNGLSKGHFGSWRLADNPMPGGGQGSAHESVDFAKRVSEHLRAKGMQPPTEAQLEILRGLQGPWADRAGGSSRAYSSGVSTPLLPWASDPAFSEATRNKIATKQGEFLDWLYDYSKRVEAGEFGNGEARNYADIVRNLRLKVRNWVKNSGLSNALLRSLLPHQEASERNIANRANSSSGEAEGFGRRRAGMLEVGANLWDANAARAELETIREAASRLASERAAAEANPEARADLERAGRAIRASSVEVVRSADIFAEAEGNRVRVSTGLLNEIHRRAVALDPEARAMGEGRLGRSNATPRVVELRARVLGLIGAHELAHISGVTAERAADLRAVEILERAHGPVTDDVIRESVRSFERPTGSSRWSNFVYRLKSFARYGTTAGRIRAMERHAAGEADPLANYRRADGTLNWKKVTGERALREVGGLAHFGLALFLKELAVVAGSGDRARIEEFFDGLATTDFYKHYGLFVLGARAGEVAYNRFLAGYVKPRFVSSILKTNVILAAGLALPQIVEGNFSGRTFAISLGSLGLSTAAVRSGVAGIKWVKDLKKVRTAGAATTVARASRLARVGGWFYTAAELAVILFIAEEIDEHVNHWLDAKAAREALVAAELKFIAASRAADASPESLGEAAAEFHGAWTDYRDFLFKPLQADDVLFSARLERAAEKAKKTADRHKAALERIKDHPALLRSTEARHGSLEAYAAKLVAEEKAALEAQVETYANSYTASREKNIRKVYEEGRRDGSYLGEVEELAYVIAGATPGAESDPWEGRNDVVARRGRARLVRGLRNALNEPSENRLQAYDDELEVLDAVRAALTAAGKDELAGALDRVRDMTAKTKVLDDRLVNGNGDGIVTLASDRDAEGAAAAIESAGE